MSHDIKYFHLMAIWISLFIKSLFSPPLGFLPFSFLFINAWHKSFARYFYSRPFGRDFGRYSGGKVSRLRGLTRGRTGE